MTANPTSSIAASASSTVDLDAQASRAADGELSARLQSDVIPLLEPLYQHVMPMTRNHADAEDLLQETIVKAYAGFRTFQPGGNFHAWLHRILINTYISYYRKQQCRPAQYPIDDVAGPQLPPTPNTWCPVCTRPRSRHWRGWATARFGPRCRRYPSSSASRSTTPTWKVSVPGRWWGRKPMIASLEESLPRLRTDYVDLLWLHSWDPRVPLEETLRAH